MKLKILRISVTAILLFCSTLIFADVYRIALRAHHGDAKSMSLWQATADYLSSKIPEHEFILVPFENIGVMNQAVSRGEFKFSITNPASVVEYQIRYGFEPVATLVNKRQRKGYSKFGAVIFTRTDRADINSFNDLINKTVMSVDELAFGGWRIAWLELLKNKINPFEDFKNVMFAGGSQQDVVYSVRDKKSDAGVVRTDTLERLALSNKIKLTDFKILGRKNVDGFPFLLSTSLYPEWSFSVAKDIAPALKSKVIKALLSIKEKDKAAIDGMYVHWADQLNLNSVKGLLKELKVGPYNVAEMNGLQRLIMQYGVMLFVAIGIILSLTFAILYTLKLNRQITSTKKALKDEEDFRIKLERQLMHSQRIESLGQLTGGIAHDFNNGLASINGFTELSLLNDTVKNNEKLSEYLNNVLAASDKCAELVTQLTAFSKTANETDKKEKLSVSSLINGIVLLLQPSLPANITLKVSDIDDGLFINTNSANINQVMMNLFLNSKDAIADKSGTITLGAEAVSFEPLDVFCDSCHQDIRGAYISLYVKDDGCGIDEDINDNLFAPFFSTKDVEDRKGMGLSMVHGLIHKQDGHVLVNSNVDKGTEIKILLPQITSTNKTDIKNTMNKEKVKLSSQLIMIVDDEVSLTIYLAEFLQQQGFRVISFNHSEEALYYFKSHSDEVSIVITDQTMPGLTGIQLAEKLLECRDDIFIILCSGYGEALRDEVNSMPNISAYVEKPIQSDKLLDLIYSSFMT